MNPMLLWLIAGSILCLMELFLPTAFVELMMGVSALIVAGISLVLPHLGLQIFLWMVLSVTGVFVSRRFLPKKRVAILEESKVAHTLTVIPAGETGRVLYEGNSWSARCDDENRSIAPDQKVIVIGRQGNTLIVMPENLLYLESKQ